MTRSKRTIVATLGAIAATVVALAAPTAANAAFGIAKWEAGTCKVSTCDYSSPECQFFTQVAGRPNFGITDFEFNNSGGHARRRGGRRPCRSPPGAQRESAGDAAVH